MNIRKKLYAFLLVCLAVTLLSGCEKNSVRVLRIYNWSDYIEEGLLDEFKEYIFEKTGEEIDIVYNTYETNEVMYNTMRTGKTTYDLICPSEYMIQKMKKENMLQELDTTLLDIYFDSISPFFQDLLDDNYLRSWSAGYMWGTLGIIYNPKILESRNPNYNINSWDVFWDPLLKGTGSVKDAVRDTYASTVLKVYRDEIIDLQAKYGNDVTAAGYNTELVKIMNRVDDDTLQKVENALRSLKDNIYGMEVDSGKGDIVTGKIAMNLTWSGDAVYAMDQAEEMDNILKYSVPTEGANIWFDGWVVPKIATPENKDLIHEFINFVSIPENAARNMGEIGYTSAIKGDAISTLIQEWYGVGEQRAAIASLEEELLTTNPSSSRYQAILDEIAENQAIIDEADLVDCDLSYFFYGVDSDEKMIVQIDSFYLDRQFTAQFPDYETVCRCAIMTDFGDRNERVLQLWINFKADKASPLLIISLGGFVVACVGVYLYSQRSVMRRRRLQRLAMKSKKA